MNSCSCLTLLLACVVYWQAKEISRVLIGSLQELSTLGVGFVSLCEALDLTTPSGRALAAMLAVFAEFERKILRDRVKTTWLESQATRFHRPLRQPETLPEISNGFGELLHEPL